jgi:hypothetical protein
VFYHIVVSDISDEKLYVNMTREHVLANYVCPFINREVTLNRGEIYNMGFPIGMRVFRTDQPVTSDWPVDLRDHDKDNIGEISEEDSEIYQKTEQLLTHSIYRDELVKVLKNKDCDITEEIYKDAVNLLDTGGYKDLRKRLAEEISERYAFFICPYGNEAVDRNYEMVIKPSMKAYQFRIEREDEIANAGPVNEIITKAIVRSKLIVADLTGERAHCYYNAGFAHALGKPVILLAQTGTTRHFDIPGYQWHYWNSYEDLKPKFDKALLGVLIESGYVD